MLSALFALTSALGMAGAYTVNYDMAWGGALADSFRSVAAEANGNAYVSAIATVNAAGAQMWKVVKYDPAGAIAWTRDVFVANQTGVTTNMKAAIGPSNQVIMTATLDTIGGPQVSMARLSNSSGAILWQQQFGLDLAVRPVVTATRVFAIVRGVPAAPTRTFLICRNAGNGSLLWYKDLGSNTDAASVRLRVDGAGDAVVLTQKSTSCTIRKYDDVTGGVMWAYAINELWESAFEFDVLKPSGNVIVGVATDVNPRFVILAGASGAVLRTESVTSPSNAVSGVAAGLADSYYRFEQGVSGLYELRDATGLPYVQSFFEDPNDLGQIDPCGQFHLDGARLYSGSGQYEFRDARCSAEIEEFIPADATDTHQNDMATAGNSVFIVGDCDVDTTVEGVNIQGRIYRGTQKMDLRFDQFSVMKRVVPAALNAPAPGVLANDAGWYGGLLSVVNTTTNGNLTLASDGSFTYMPNGGFVGTDSFVYKMKIGPVEAFGFAQIAVIGLASVTVPQPDVVGGNNLIGTVNLTSTNRNVPIIVQLSDNSPAVAVTSSIAIPFGKASGPFNIITSPVSADTNCTITGSLQGTTATAQLLIKRAVPQSLVLDPAPLVGGQPFVGTVTMTGKAPAAGYVVTLTHSGTEIGMPTSITIAAGLATGTFDGTTQPRSIPVNHIVSATAGGVTKSVVLTINPGGLFGVSVTPTTMQGGLTATGRVAVAGIAPPGGTLVDLSVNGGKVQVPANVTVPAGQQGANFQVTTQAVVTTGTRTITAKFGNITRTCTLTLTP